MMIRVDPKSDSAFRHYQSARQLHWDQVARSFESGRGWGGYYHQRLAQFYRHTIAPGQSILEIRCGKGDAVRMGFANASGDILMILDADLTVPPEELPRFYRAPLVGKGSFINGVRLIHPMEDKAMSFINLIGNRFFSVAFSWILGQPIKDTLCGT